MGTTCQNLLGTIHGCQIFWTTGRQRTAKSSPNPPKYMCLYKMEKNRHRVCHTAYMIFRMCCFFVVVVNLFSYVSNINDVCMNVIPYFSYNL